MTDVVVLLAISQLICLGGLCYFARQVLALKGELADAIAMASLPGDDTFAAAESLEPDVPRDHLAGDVALLADRMNELGLDIPALARRMRRSEGEVRMLLQEYGVRQ